MYVYVVVIICFLPPSFSLKYLPRRTLKLNLLVVVVVLSYIYVYLHISHTFFFFFLIPFNKNFYHQPTQPTTTILVVSKFHSFLQKERRLASQKNFPINHRQRRETTTTTTKTTTTTTTLILILILYTRRQLIDYTPTKDTITLGATPIDITVSFCIKQLLLPPLPIITFFFLDKTN